MLTFHFRKMSFFHNFSLSKHFFPLSLLVLPFSTQVNIHGILVISTSKLPICHINKKTILFTKNKIKIRTF